MLSFFKLKFSLAESASQSNQLQGHHWLALVALLVGVLALLARGHRRPELGVSIFVASACCAAWFVIHDRWRDSLRLPDLVMRFACGVCVACAALGYAAGLGKKKPPNWR